MTHLLGLDVGLTAIDSDVVVRVVLVMLSVTVVRLVSVCPRAAWTVTCWSFWARVGDCGTGSWLWLILMWTGVYGVRLWVGMACGGCSLPASRVVWEVLDE